MGKIKVHIDSKGFKSKPSSIEIAGIKTRLQKNATPSSISLEELASKIEKGCSISPAVMKGMSSSDWQEQQLFLIDIDNECDEIINIDEALSICREHNLFVAFYYHTFSSSKEKPKFRLGFIMDKTVTNPDERQAVVTVLNSMFPQSDKSCTNADRIFLGTNSKAIINDRKARITMEDIYNGFTQPDIKKTNKAENSHEKTYDSDLEKLKDEYDFLDFLKRRNGNYKLTEKYALFENCEICRHKHNLVYYPETKTFYCFSSSGNCGGSIIDYLIKVENLTVNQAINKFKYELCHLERKNNEWKNPVPLREDLALPQFPIGCLPKTIKEFVIAISDNTATSIDMAGVASLAILSTALQGKFDVMVKAGYFEPLNLYILIIANPGERKSAVVRAMTKIIYQYEREENLKRQPKIDSQEAELKVKYNLIEQKIKKGDTEQVKRLKIECREIEKNLIKPLKLIADDITPEALTSLLSDCNGRLSIISTEGGLFDTLAGRYSNNVSIDTILKAHCGDPIRVDRKGRPSEYIESPALTMLLAAQENVLDGLLSNEVFKSRGLTARILYCKPKSMIGIRAFDTPEILPEIERNYIKLIFELLNIADSNDGKIYHLKLDDEAYNLLKRFHKWLEPKLIDELDNMNGWSGKFIGTTARIAGILHCAKHKNKSSQLLITENTMKRAIKISKYFLEHAKYTYSLMGTDKVLQGAKQILKKLEKQTEKEFTKYQVFRLCRGHFTKAEDVLPSLEMLIEYGYLKEKTIDVPTGGRPKGNKYILNPKYFDK